MYPAIEDDYYGIKIYFGWNPVSGVAKREFIFSGRELIQFLAQSHPMGYELLMPELKFLLELQQFPTKASSPLEWLDVALLLEQGKHNAKTPTFMLDVGGRKITCLIPSDRYFYDRGALPLYAAKAGIPSPTHISEKESVLVFPGESSEKDKIVTDPSVKGDEPLLNKQKKERFTYMNLYEELESFYQDKLDDRAIARECRRILSGKRLSSRHAKVIPLMLAALFGAEVSRNRAALVTSIMLLDLIECQVIAPTQNGEEVLFCFRNSLWNPNSYGLTKKERNSDPNKRESDRLGGFFPMAHGDSWRNEFAESPYQVKEQLKISHIKSVVILIKWLCHLRLDGIKIVPLNKKDYEREYAQEQTELYENFEREDENYRNNLLVLQAYIRPLITKRLSSFDQMLPSSKEAEKQNEEEFLTQEDLISESILAALKIEVEEICEKKIAQHKEFSEKYRSEIQMPPKLSVATNDEIDREVSSSDTALAYINKIDPQFTLEKLHYCLDQTNVNIKVLVKIFMRLNLINNFSSLKLINLILNSEEQEKKLLYKLIFSSPYLFYKLSAENDSKSQFINSISCQIPMRAELVEALMHETARPIILALCANDIFELCDNSSVFFRNIIIFHPEIFKKMLYSSDVVGYLPIASYKISNLIFRDIQSPQDWRAILKHNYNNVINGFAQSHGGDFDANVNEGGHQSCTIPITPILVKHSSIFEEKCTSPPPPSPTNEADAANLDTLKKDEFSQTTINKF